MRRWFLVLAVGVLLVAGCGDDGGDEPPVTTSPGGQTIEVDVTEDREVEARPGDRVVLTVEQNASIGEHWGVADPPDLEVAQVVDRESELDDPDADGGGGTVSYTLQAVGEGETTVRLRKCYRCDAEGHATPGTESRAETVDVEITVEGGGGGGGVDPDDAAVVLDQDERSAEVEAGDLVAVVLEENGSIGDRWEIWNDPDTTVLQVVGERVDIDDPEAAGSGGTVSTVFVAVEQGETDLTFHNCYRCDSEGNTGPDDAPLAVDLTFEVRVR